MPSLKKSKINYISVKQNVKKASEQVNSDSADDFWNAWKDHDDFFHRIDGITLNTFQEEIPYNVKKRVRNKQQENEVKANHLTQPKS